MPNEKAILCGHSMGGYILLDYADQYPRRMSGIGLITTRAEADTEAGRTDRYKMMEAVKKKGAEPLAESLGPRLTKDKELVQEIRNMLSETSAKGIIGSLEGMASRPDRREYLPEITVPALVVAGGEDQIIDLESAKQMADALPNGVFLSIPDAGHLPMLETPEALGVGLLALARRVEGLEG